MKLTHPKSKQVIEVDAAHATPYLSQGWLEVVEAPALTKRGKQPADDPQD